MKIKHLWIPFVVFFLLAVPLRVYQILVLITPKDGFLPDGDLTMPLLLVLLAVFVLVLIVMCGLCKNVPESYQFQKNIGAGLFSCLAGALLLGESANLLVRYVLNEGSIPMMVLSIASILAGAALITIGVCTFRGKNIFDRVPLFSLITSLWCCIRLIITFLTYTNYAATSNDMFDILGIIFMLLFLFTQAKLFTGLSDGRTIKRLYLFGLAAILMLTTFNVLELLRNYVEEYSFVLSDMMPHLVDLALVLYIFSILVQTTKYYSQPVQVVAEAQPSRPNLEDPEILDHAVGKREASRPEAKPLFFDSLVNEQEKEERAKSVEKEDVLPRQHTAPAEKKAQALPVEEKRAPRGESLDMEHIDQLIEDICKDQEIIDMLDKK